MRSTAKKHSKSTRGTQYSEGDFPAFRLEGRATPRPVLRSLIQFKRRPAARPLLFEVWGRPMATGR